MEKCTFGEVSLKVSAMKRIFTTLSIALLMAKGILAQDTARVCAPMLPYLGSGNFSLMYMCPNATGFETIIGVVNGDSMMLIPPIGFLVSSVPLGAEGTLNVYCDGIVSGIPDSSIYFILNTMPQICVVTTDADNHPVVYVDSSTLTGNHSLSLQRKVNTLSWVTVATFTPSDTLAIKDTTANTATQSYEYRIGASLDCVGYQHSTIHLQANGNNLSWNQYQGGLFQLRGYYIYKRSGMGMFALIDSTSSLSYTDLNFQSGDEYYIGAYKDDGCQSNSWRAASPIMVRSNTLQIGTSGITETEQILKRYYVEGSTLYVELKKANDVSLYDIAGRELIHKHTDNFDLQLQPGIYILNVGAKGYKVLIP